MASVARDPRSKFWYACFYDHRGKQVKRSTGLTSRSRALRMAVKLEEAARLARARTLTEDRARGITSEMIADSYGGEGLRTFSPREWFEHLAKIKADSQDSKTVAKYEQIK